MGKDLKINKITKAFTSQGIKELDSIFLKLNDIKFIKNTKNLLLIYDAFESSSDEALPIKVDDASKMFLLGENEYIPEFNKKISLKLKNKGVENEDEKTKERPWDFEYGNDGTTPIALRVFLTDRQVTELAADANDSQLISYVHSNSILNINNHHGWWIYLTYIENAHKTMLENRNAFIEYK